MENDFGFFYYVLVIVGLILVRFLLYNSSKRELKKLLRTLVKKGNTIRTIQGSISKLDLDNLQVDNTYTEPFEAGYTFMYKDERYRVLFIETITGNVFFSLSKY